MGQTLQAICACGYTSELLCQGVGFSGVDGFFYEPVYCDHCGKVDTADGRQERPLCETCQHPVHFYYNLKTRPLDVLGFPKTDYLDEDARWHCPACKQKTLTFVFAGLWD